MQHNYNGPEIISKLIINPIGVRGGGKIKQRQEILVKCHRCKGIKFVGYAGHALNRLKSKNDEYECRSCVARNTLTTYNKSCLGKTLEERLGEDKARISKEKNRKYSLLHNTGGRLTNYTGVSWEEKYGIERSNELKEEFRKNNKLPIKYGEDNPQWGKPAHKLSGKGTKGYYNGIYFRSLMEASFIIKYLEPNNIIFENGECKKYAIPYIYENKLRNYFCDFVANGIFYEIKPHALHKSRQNIAKWEYAEVWCKDRGYEFKIFSEYDYNKLSQEEIDNLKKCGKLILI